MIKVQVWTDGSSDWNTREGGWASVITIPTDYGLSTKLTCGYQSDTTNNAMEAYSLCGAMLALTKPCVIDFVTDSQYVVYGVRRILANKQLLESNTTVWELIKKAMEDGGHTIGISKVKGHVGEPLNEIADRLAVYARKQKTAFSTVYEDFDQPAIREFMGHLRAGSL